MSGEKWTERVQPRSGTPLRRSLTSAAGVPGLDALPSRFGSERWLSPENGSLPDIWSQETGRAVAGACREPDRVIAGREAVSVRRSFRLLVSGTAGAPRPQPMATRRPMSTTRPPGIEKRCSRSAGPVRWKLPSRRESLRRMAARVIQSADCPPAESKVAADR